MSRVSDKSSSTAVEHAMNKTKSKMEDLQLKGSSLKRMTKPSDDPVGNLRLLEMRSDKVNLDQYARNSNLAVTMLEFTENSVQELADLLMKSKEMAIAQSSDIYNAELRKSVAKEVAQMYQQAISIGNRRMGNRYIFGGYKSDIPPFSQDGKYLGDTNSSFLEVMKDFFVPTNAPGSEVFFLPPEQGKEKITAYSLESALKGSPDQSKEEISSDGLLSQLRLFYEALMTNNTDSIQGLLNRFDSSLDRLTIVRTQIGSYINTIRNSENILDNQNLLNAKQKSQIEDADLAEIYSDISKQQNVMKAVYKTSAQLLDEGLLKFIR